jgi:4-hydroxybenzoate polyprenyltransferase
MAAGTAAGLSWSVALRLGRVSNLPTVWSNVLVGMVIAGASPADLRLPLLLAALSAAYVGGMFLNDWFDRHIDARQRPDRPIPSGEVDASVVLATGLGLLASALVLLAWAGYGFAGGTGWRPVAAGVALAGAIVFYDWHHKGNVLSPVVMGVCRMLVYITAGFAVSADPPALLYVAALLMLAYLIGLTYTAKREHLNELGSQWPLLCLAVPALYGAWAAFAAPVVWVFLALFVAWVAHSLRLLVRRAAGDVPRAVVSLIAGISLLDAMLLSAVGAPGAALAAVAAFGLTLALQRRVAGT